MGLSCRARAARGLVQPPNRGSSARGAPLGCSPSGHNRAQRHAAGGSAARTPALPFLPCSRSSEPIGRRRAPAPRVPLFYWLTGLHSAAAAISLEEGGRAVRSQLGGQSAGPLRNQWRALLAAANSGAAPSPIYSGAGARRSLSRRAAAGCGWCHGPEPRRAAGCAQVPKHPPPRQPAPLPAAAVR